MAPRTRGGHSRPSSSSQHEDVDDTLSGGQQRPYVGGVERKGFIDTSVTCAAVKDLKSHLTGPWATFAAIPADVRRVLWESFQAQYSWPTDEEAVVRAAWEASLTRRLTQILSYDRGEALKRVGSTDLAATRGRGPTWLTYTTWEGLLAHWLRPDWIDKSSKAQSNRKTLKEGSITRHSGGSISFASHEARLAKELGRPPTKKEIFMRMHTKKGSESFVDDRSRVVAERYDTLISQKYGPTGSTQTVFDQNVWLEATGGLTKGMVYGFGGYSYGTGGSSSRESVNQPDLHARCVSRDELDDHIRRIVSELLATTGGGSKSREAVADDVDDEEEEEEGDDE